GPQGATGPQGAQGPKGDTGSQGLPGLPIDWLGEFESAPTSPSLNQAYYNTTDGISYVWTSEGWDVMAKDGIQGPQGAVGPQGPQGSKGDTGDTGPQGAPGADGVSLSWLGTFTSFPISPSENEAFYNQTLGKSYIWDGDSWELITQDGLQGIQGPVGPQGPQGPEGEPGTGLVNQGNWVSGTLYDSGDYVFAESSTTPGVNSMFICETDAYTSTTEPKDDGANWVEFQAPEGPQGPQGETGPAGPQGNPGVSVQWLGELASAPVSPTVNQAYYNTTDGKSYVYNGSTWSIIAQDGTVGPEGPVVSGTSGQMLVHNGTSWTASSNVFTDGSQNVGVGTTSPTAKLDVNGTIRIRGGYPSSGMVLTSDGTGLGSWQAPSYSNWTVSGNNIYNSNSGFVGINMATTDMQSNLVVRQTASPMSGNRILLNSLAADFRQNTASNGYASGIKFTLGNTSAYTGTAAIVAERTGSWSQGRLHFAVNDVGASGKADIPIAMTIDGPSGGKVGIGTLTPTEQLDVQGNIKASGALIGQSLQVGTPVVDPESPLFVVRNSNNEIVFAVYESGVRMYVASDVGKAGSKGGFAVGGLTQSKAGEEYFRVTPDSVRIYIDTTTTVTKSGSKGGFAVGGLTQSKGLPYDLMKVTGYSTRIYVDGGAAKSGSKGGFAVGGLTQSKLASSDFLYISPDSARIYIDDDPLGKSGSKGGFAVGGLTQSKGIAEDYLRITRDSSRIYVNTSPTKSGSKGGFAVGGLTQSKGIEDRFMDITPENYLIGQQAGLLLNNGQYNSFMGYQAGRNVTDGSKNVYIGTDAGMNNSLGNENIFIGYRTGAVGGAGNLNTFLGLEAGLENTGDDNTFIGYHAGWTHQNKGGNVYLGSKAGENSTYGEQNVFIGESAGQKTTYGHKNVFIGFQSGFNNTGSSTLEYYGSYNVFLGNQSGFTNSTGRYNVFLGNLSGYSNISGYSNVFLGNESGYNNTYGYYNVFIGYKSGWTNTTADYNTFLGYEAGYTNNAGYNVFLGYQAGKANSSGASNVFVGNKAGTANISGANNVFIGFEAGRDNDDGNYNLFMGYRAGYNNEGGNNNTFIGYQAGYNNIDGVNNIFMGYMAGYSNVAGDSNLFLGYKAGYTNESGNSNTFLGYASGEMAIGGMNTFVGSYAGNLCTGGTGNVLIGANAGAKITSGSRNTIIGWRAAKDQTTGSGNVYIGYDVGYGLNESNTLRIHNNSNYPPIIYGEFRTTPYPRYLKFNASTSVNYNPGSVYDVYGLWVDGGFSSSFSMYVRKGATTNGSWASDSDVRYKKDVKTLEGVTEMIKMIRGVRFMFRTDEFVKQGFSEREQIGVIAQELEAVFPELVFTDHEGYKSVAYGKLSAVLLQAIKEQQAEIDELKQAKAENEELKARLERLEKLILEKE
ncbi:MAG TPA: tail fiber domain-containing protein, partial [Tenuifilaceae bacterium]|nr:tail fiber domain-containing protein [Tenuifilaceae bacterium]